MIASDRADIDGIIKWAENGRFRIANHEIEIKN